MLKFFFHVADEGKAQYMKSMFKLYLHEVTKTEEHAQNMKSMLKFYLIASFERK